jgi:hypothetical protein
VLSDKEFGDIKAYLEKFLGHKISNRRIAAIGVNPLYHGQAKRLIEVGRVYADLEPGSPADQVVAIFETKLFCVCTANRGAGQGMPYMFTRDTVYDVIDAPGGDLK